MQSPAVGSEPQAPVPVFHNVFHVVTDQPISNGVIDKSLAIVTTDVPVADSKP